MSEPERLDKILNQTWGNQEELLDVLEWTMEFLNKMTEAEYRKHGAIPVIGKIYFFLSKYGRVPDLQETFAEMEKVLDKELAVC